MINVVFKSVVIALVLSVVVSLVDECLGTMVVRTETLDRDQYLDMTMREVNAWTVVHEKEITKLEWALPHFGRSWFWIMILKNSIVSFVGIFAGCMWLTYWQRGRRSKPQ